MAINQKLLAAIVFMLLGATFIPIGDAIAKHLSSVTDYTAIQLAWIRFSIGACILLPIAFAKFSITGLNRTFYVRQSVRGVLIALTVSAIIQAVSLSPIAEVFGVFFIGPILSVVLAVAMLKETASIAEWFSVVLGFAGVLLVVQPGFLGFADSGGMTNDASSRAGLYWALLAGVFYGCFLVATRWAAGFGPPLAQVSLQFLVAAIVLTPFALVSFFDKGIQSLYWLITMSVTSLLANYFSILALARASAGTIAPVVYFQVVAATIIGLSVFGETLGLVAAIGLIIIVVSGFFRLTPHA